MITRINEHTIRLEPDAPKQRVTQQPRKALSPMQRKISGMAVDAIKNAMDAEMWLRRQIRRSDDYMRALEVAGCTKANGVRGYICPPSAKVMLRPGEARRWASRK